MNYYYGIELYHHGIKGQKWGVQNGPPYPLSDGQRSKSESRLNPKQGRLGYGEELVVEAATLALLTIGTKVVSRISRENAYKKNKDKVDKIIDEKMNIKYSDIYHVNNAKVAEQYLNRNEGKVDKKVGLVLKQKEFNEDEDMAAVNPEYGSYNYASVNCGLCTCAYDLRRRGYDVIAGYSDLGVNPGYFKQLYPKSERKDWAGNYGKSSYGLGKRLTKEECESTIIGLSKDKNSRGAMFVMWAGSSGGHAIAYTVSKDGVLTIRDTQSNKSYTGDKAIKLLRSASYVGTTRLDNVEPDYEFIKKERVVR